tara:strand:- start:11595 stop:12737 length:1143 start_codon:yes stop_codon:yes gene_type:complete
MVGLLDNFEQRKQNMSQFNNGGWAGECHDIQANDHLVLANGQKAWHGLGTVVQDSPTPFEALELAKLDWDVLESEVLTGKFFNPQTSELYSVNSDERKMLIRSDDNMPLGIVGRNYQPVQNKQLAELCYEIASAGIGDNKVKVETAGSMGGGRRVWFLLRSDSIDLGPNGCDKVFPYLMMTNGHDGSLALHFIPTTCRVVCRNTHRIAMADGSEFRSFLKHTSNILESLPAVIEQLKSGVKVQEGHADQMRFMDSNSLKTSDVQNLWTRVYMRLFGDPSKAVASDPTRTFKLQERRQEKMETVLGEWSNIWQKEVDTFGLQSNSWTAYNAVSNWLDHDKPVRIRNRTGSVIQEEEARLGTNMFGTTSKQKQVAFEMALTS